MEKGAAGMTHYEFFFRCGKCGERSKVRYRVPRTSASTPLSCKNCETVMLKIEARGGRTYTYTYSVWDAVRERQVLHRASRDGFWGWVVDHGGDRYED